VASNHVTVTVQIDSFDQTKLFVWTVWQLVHEMRVSADPYAPRLESALERFVHSFTEHETSTQFGPYSDDDNGNDNEVPHG
jgi:hypothetical protein